MKVKEHPLYNTWKGMKERCYRPNATNYERYGGRGILVAEDWYNDFWLFAAQIGPKPTPEHTLDRVDNNWHYCAENCKWSTEQEQKANRRNRKRKPDCKGYVWVEERQRFNVLICIGKKQHYFGTFKTEDEAQARAEAVYSIVRPQG